MTSCLLWKNKNSNFIFSVLLQTISDLKINGSYLHLRLVSSSSTSFPETCVAVCLSQYEISSRPGVLVFLPEAAFLGFLIVWAHVWGSSFFPRGFRCCSQSTALTEWEQRVLDATPMGSDCQQHSYKSKVMLNHVFVDSNSLFDPISYWKKRLTATLSFILWFSRDFIGLVLYWWTIIKCVEKQENFFFSWTWLKNGGL